MSQPFENVVGVFSRGILRIPHLDQLLGAKVRPLGMLNFGKVSALAGWGMRSTARRAIRHAARLGLPYLALEDGFLRSLGTSEHCPPLSLVIDQQGIYYDSTRPSALEGLLASPTDVLEGISDAVARARELLLEHRLSKYNHASLLAAGVLRSDDVQRVLVIDQTAGDMSVALGGANADTFSVMLAAARAENPRATIYVKTHPEVSSGRKGGYLTQVQDDEHTVVLRQAINPLSLIEHMDRVYTVTSTMGFEALLAGKSVTVFGMPWYAGWGAADERQTCVRRTCTRSVHELFAAAYFHYTRYLNPETQQRGTIFDVIDWLVRNKAINDVTRGNLYCVGMSLWKRAIVRPFLSTPSCRVHFVRSAKALARRALPPNAKIVIWGIKAEQEISAIAAAKQVTLWRMEDGFLRSVGLGSDLFRPVSLVLDQGGIYYDPASNSTLERMLAMPILSDAALDRAARFRQAFVLMRMSKYNLGHSPLQVAAQGRRVLLVPGQVEDDASILRGSPVVRTNLALLQTVRTAHPDAWILYKAHPDVVAGNRRGMVDTHVLMQLADQCVADANIIDCILAADEVHTMTSLSGFEALLHGRAVHCYGGPFYAGWGLTVDHFTLPQRRPDVSLDALVFAVMLQYPRYVLPGLAGFVSAERVMAWLAEQAAASSIEVLHAGWHGWLARKGRKVRALTQLFRDEWKALRSV